MSSNIQDHAFDGVHGNNYIRTNNNVANNPYTNDEKPSDEYVEEKVGHVPTHGTYIEGDAAHALPLHHQQYLIERHGTTQLDPLPGIGDADPYNWRQSKVSISCSV